MPGMALSHELGLQLHDLGFSVLVIHRSSRRVRFRSILGQISEAYQEPSRSRALGSDAVWSRSLTSFEMTEKFNVSFRGLPEKSFSSRTILYETASPPTFGLCLQITNSCDYL